MHVPFQIPKNLAKGGSTGPQALDHARAPVQALGLRVGGLGLKSETSGQNPKPETLERMPPCLSRRR